LILIVQGLTFLLELFNENLQVVVFQPDFTVQPFAVFFLQNGSDQVLFFCVKVVSEFLNLPFLTLNIRIKSLHRLIGILDGLYLIFGLGIQLNTLACLLG
jgi:hypothetical protein